MSVALTPRGARSSSVPGAGTDARLSALVGMGRALRAARSSSDVVELVAEEALAALGASSVSLSRWEPARRCLRVLVNVGDLAPGEERWPLDEVYSGEEFPELYKVVHRGEVTLHVLDDPSCHPVEAELLRSLGKTSAVSATIRHEGRYWGELYATRDGSVPPFTVDDLVYAEAVADYVAVGLSHADHVAEVSHLAFEDSLTGLANRRAADSRLDEAIARHQRDGTAVSVVLLDVNGLKRVNDESGHEAGDRLLVETARILERATEGVPGCLPARLGGDEFCVVLVGEVADRAVQLAQEICREAWRVPGGFGVSCGVASTDEPGVGPLGEARQLLRLADAAQYRAKRAHARDPVVAGRTALGMDAAAEPHDGDRRLARGRLESDPARLLADCLHALDSSGAVAVRDRLRVVAGVVAVQVDAAAWFLSLAPPGEAVMTVTDESASRLSEQGAPEWSSSMLGSEWPLDEYPQSASAMAGGSFVTDLGDPGNDPAEDAVLVASGYTSCVGAGGVDAAGRAWLVEVFTDTFSASVTCLGPTLRALVACALAVRS